MFAAVVRSFDSPPRYEQFPDPQLASPHQEVVQVLAAALHPRVRSAANGTHYESSSELPLVPGVDGVGRTERGGLVYFALPDATAGSMAEQVVVDRRRCALLPADVDPVTIAAAMNPAMSSWVALRRRVLLEPDQSVLVMGATGSAGRLAVQIARFLGAGAVVAAGRDTQRLEAVRSNGADRVVRLTDASDRAADERAADERAADELAAAAADVDVVLDYLWGSVAQWAIPALLRARADRSRPLSWIAIGSMSGLEVPVASEWLRAARLSLVGSGQGSVPTPDIVAELPGLAAYLTDAGTTVDARAVQLSEVTAAWTASTPSGQRLVFVP